VNRTRTAVVGLLAVALVATACGGDDDTAAETTAPTTTAAPATTQTPTTTAATTTTEAPATTEAPTTTVVELPPMPLTGLPIPNDLLPLRRALVVKIDNHPQARPQFGLNAADIVFEENVENLTRFAAVFHSQDAERVGPIRSGRTQDVTLLGSFNKPLFAWSGGNGNVTAAVKASDLVNLSPAAVSNSGYYRAPRGNEDIEHTLYNSTQSLWTHQPDELSPPPAQFTYRDDGVAAAGEASPGVDVKMDGVEAGWTWDGTTASYLRTQGGKAHNDATLGQVNAANVVILEVDYQPSPADARSPEAQTIGTGTAWVYTGGVLVRGTWTRNDRLEPFTLTDASGAVIGLTPGRTWVELPRVGKVTPRA
jgi:hypothetical protein